MRTYLVEAIAAQQTRELAELCCRLKLPPSLHFNEVCQRQQLMLLAKVSRPVPHQLQAFWKLLLPARRVNEEKNVIHNNNNNNNNTQACEVIIRNLRCHIQLASYTGTYNESLVNAVLVRFVHGTGMPIYGVVRQHFIALYCMHVIIHNLRCHIQLAGYTRTHNESLVNAVLVQCVRDTGMPICDAVRQHFIALYCIHVYSKSSFLIPVIVSCQLHILCFDLN